MLKQINPLKSLCFYGEIFSLIILSSIMIWMFMFIVPSVLGLLVVYLMLSHFEIVIVFEPNNALIADLNYIKLFYNQKDVDFLKICNIQ